PRDAAGRINNCFVLIVPKTFLTSGYTRIRSFLARIIGSDDGVIGILVDAAGHERSLLPIPIAPTAENYNQSARFQFAQCFEHIEQGVGRVCIIDIDLKLPFGWNSLEPAWYLRRFTQTKNRRPQSDAERICRSQCSQRI